MDSLETDDTGVFSPPKTKRNSTPKHFHDEQNNISASDGTDVFSPDVSFRSGNIKLLNFRGNEENTSPQIQTPSFTKQLEDVERKGAKRKSRFGSVLNSQNSEDDSFTFDDLESQEINTKRIKRFQLSSEKSADDSKSDDNSIFSDIFKSVSEDKNKAKRKNVFVIPSSQQSEDSLQYSEIFKSVSSKAEKIKRYKRFVSPSSQESADSTRYSDISVFRNKSSIKKKNHFIDPASQGVEDSLRYSDISISQNNTNVEKRNHFIDPASQGVEDSLRYSDISIPQNDTNVKKINHFVDPASQGVEDTHYSDISISQTESNLKNKNHFIDPASQDVENSLRYSDISISTIKSNVEQVIRFVVTASQEGEGSLHYSNISVSQTEPKDEKKHRFIDPTSQEIGNSLQYSDITISKDENRLSSRFVVPNSQNSMNDSITLNLSSQSECISSKTVESSTLCENPKEMDHHKCEKTSVSDFTSVRSICIDTMRSSFDISTPLISEMTGKQINLTYDVSTSAFNQPEDVIPSVNTDLSKSNELKNATYNLENIGSLNIPVIPTLNTSCERTLIASNSLEDVNGSITLIESKNESSNIQESSSTVNDSSNLTKNSKTERDEITESNNTPVMSIQSIMIDTISISNAPPSNEKTPLIESKKESSNLIQESSLTLNDASNSIENSKIVRDEITESNDTPAISTQSVVIDTIPNTRTSNVPPSNEKSVLIEANNLSSNAPSNSVVNVSNGGENSKNELDEVTQSNVTPVEESVYVAFNPSSLMLSVTVVESLPNNNDRDFSIAKNKSNQLVELLLPDNAPKDESSSPALHVDEKNIKEHDYAAVQVSNLEEVEKPGADLVNIPSTEIMANFTVNVEIQAHNGESVGDESDKIPVDISHPKEPAAEGTSRVPMAEEISKESAGVETDIRSNEEIGKESTKPSTDIPSIEAIPQGDSIVSPPTSEVQPIPNDVEITKKTPSPNASIQSTNRSLLPQKSILNMGNEPNTSILSVKNYVLQQPSSIVEELEKSSTSVSPTNIVQFHEPTFTPDDSLPKSSYSLRSRNSRSSGSQKNQEPVPSTSAAFFNSSNSVNEIPSRNSSAISSQKGNYSSRWRSSTSSNTQNNRTFASSGSVSVFSISKIGRRSTAPTEFKVPQVPKIVPKKKKIKKDQSFKHLPSRPNFPKFDFYCNQRFYSYLTKTMEPKYGIKTNNEAVKLAKYISNVVKEVIAMKTRDHHILVEEMKKVLFQKGIVTTHYSFYIFCFDYMPAWFRRKAIPMMMPVGCPPNVEFDVSVLFDSIE